MPDLFLLLLSLLIGIAVGLVIARLRKRHPGHVMPQSLPIGTASVEDLTARLAERSREVNALRARLAAMERLEKDLSLSDPLTGIANRVLLTERIDHAITRGQRHNSRLGLVVLDLKDFGAINERLGKQTGDRLLIAVARKLREVMRAEDTVSHLRGDRFAIALEGVFEREDIGRAQESVLRVFADPFDLDGQSVTLEARIGSALYPADGTDAEALLRAAEHGLSQARKNLKASRTPSAGKVHDAARPPRHALNVK